jgi:hypothetical protein
LKNLFSWSSENVQQHTYPWLRFHWLRSQFEVCIPGKRHCGRAPIWVCWEAKFTCKVVNSIKQADVRSDDWTNLLQVSASALLESVLVHSNCLSSEGPTPHGMISLRKRCLECSFDSGKFCSGSILAQKYIGEDKRELLSLAFLTNPLSESERCKIPEWNHVN